MQSGSQSEDGYTPEREGPKVRGKNQKGQFGYLIIIHLLTKNRMNFETSCVFFN